MQPNNTRKNTAALLSFIVGITGLGLEIIFFATRILPAANFLLIMIPIGFFLAVLAVIFGIIALIQMRRIGSVSNNRWMAIVGMVIGFLTSLFDILLVYALILALRSFS